MQQKIYLKPIKSNSKTVVLEDAHLLTPEAQNALLKVLEEPPEHTYIFLSAENKDVLLPTIISRCKIVSLEADIVTVTQVEKEEYEAFIKLLPKMKIGEILKKAELLSKNKDQSLVWIEKLLIVLHDKVTDEALQGNKPSQFSIQFLKSLQNLYVTLKTTNVNARFAIEQTFLTFYDRIKE